MSEACSIIYYIAYIITILHRTPDLFIATYYMGHAVAQLVEALRYKPESREFDSR